MDFTRYEIAALYAHEINQGYSANLCGINRCPYIKDEAKKAAWQHGHALAQKHVEGK